MRPRWVEAAREQRAAEANLLEHSFKADTDAEYRRKRRNGGHRGRSSQAVARKLSKLWAELDQAEQEGAEP